jgi:NADPH2:quinone reductase
MTDGKGVDVILDMVAGSYVDRNIEALAPDGRLVHIATMEGPTADVDIRQVMVKRLVVTGSTLRPQSDERKAEMGRAIRQRVWPLIDQGTIRPVVHTTFPLAEAAAAHRLMESSAHIGKIVLTV